MGPANPMPVPAVGVGAIVFDTGGRVLLIRRGQPPRQGFWSVPGGRLEPGEDLAECCRRETLEETGLVIVPGPIVAVAERRAESFHYIIVDFLATLGDGPSEPSPASDAAAARWVALPDLTGFELVEGLAEAIRAARRCLEGGGGLAARVGAGGLFLPRMPGTASADPGAAGVRNAPAD